MSKNSRESNEGRRTLTERVAESERVSEAVLDAVDTVSKHDVIGSTAPDGTATSRAPGPLYESIDPDALDKLFRPTPSGKARSEGTVTFDYADCEITVHSDGLLRVRPSKRTAVTND